jgi:hypothetical protein
MRGMKVGTVVAWGLVTGLTCVESAFGQVPPIAYPPQATAPVPPPAPPVLVPGRPAPAPPAPPAAPLWTPGVPLDLQAVVPWAGVWMDRNGLAHPWNAYAAQQPGERRVETMDAPFPDPTRPGSIVVQLLSGSIRVKAANRKDVGIRVSHSGRQSVLPRKPEPPPAGMRRLTPAPQSALTADGDAQGNQISLRLSSPFVEADLELEVPARTNLNLRVVSGGAIDVEGVEGNIEVNNVNGLIHLRGVSGSVVASAVNGDVTVVMTRVADQKVMAFSSLNGKLDVTLPRTTKANLKLRSDNGDVFTDFDVAQLQSTPSSASASSTQTFQWTGQSRSSSRALRRSQRDNNGTIYGTINGGGPEIEARSFNGSVFIRRGAQ